MKQLILKDGTVYDLKNAQRVFSYDRNFDPPREKNIVSIDIDITESVNYEAVVEKLNAQETPEFTITEDEISESFTDYELWTITEQIGVNVDAIHVEYLKKVAE